jgi:hypothetical protein
MATAAMRQTGKSEKLPKKTARGGTAQHEGANR